MAQIKDVMTPNCQWVAPEASIAQAAQAMRDQDIGFLPVGENDRLIGMITDRDIAIRSAAAGQNPSQATVREAMTEKTYYCYDDQDVEEI